MTDQGGVENKPQFQPMNSRQRRVFGVLIEKAKTTPDAYPMTLNGIVTGCNQKSNREPLMTLTPEDVEQILDELRAIHAVTEVQGSGRVAKYRHHAYEWLGVDKYEISVMTELLLRGEQTLGDLRARGPHEWNRSRIKQPLKQIVDGLLKKQLMVELTPPGRGQIVTHNLYKEREITELRAQYKNHVPERSYDEDRPATSSSAPSSTPAAVRPATPAAPAIKSVSADEFSELRVEVAELQADVARLRQQVRDLEAKLA